MTIELNMMLTMAVGIFALLLGRLLNNSFGFLRKICIPSPVSGGIAFSLLTLCLYSMFGLEIKFDGTLKDICMTVFFTSVGLQSDLKVLKKGGRPLLMMVILVAVLIICQNLIGVGIARGIGVNPLIGMSAGSITMCGGHGTAAGFSQMLESMGLLSAANVTMAAATFGLLCGSLLGGPLAESIIRKRSLAADFHACASSSVKPLSSVNLTASGYARGIYEIFIAAGIGSLLSRLIALTGLTCPSYFGALIVAVIIRNLGEAIPHIPHTPVSEIGSISEVSLSLFLGMAMVSLRLWELSGLALPLLLILTAQVLFLVVFARFAAFPLLGRDYDAAVLVSGLCGFGLGATPNAMANMSAVCSKYRYASAPFFLVPIVGAMFVDIINIVVSTIFLNIL